MRVKGAWQRVDRGMTSRPASVGLPDGVATGVGLSELLGAGREAGRAAASRRGTGMLALHPALSIQMTRATPDDDPHR